jgi:valyl-tRNA synthetase
VQDPYRIVTAPTPVVGGLRVATATGLVSVDALLRRARADGRRTEWAAAALGGALAQQRAVEQALARRGTDRATVGRDGFADEARAFAAETEDQLRAQLDALGIAPPDRPGRTGSASSVAAARTAFVRLYERGLLQLSQSVAPECPRCRTVVDGLDCEPVEVEDELLAARLPYQDGDGWLELDVAAPELLAGAVAVAVPEGHEGEGRRVLLPMGDAMVPVVVVVDRRRRRPRAVVPAHTADDLELARREGLVPVEVVDGEGIVRAAGPLDGLPRFAARTAARELLAAAGALGRSRAIGVAERRCLRCGTLVVPRLGMRWSLDLGALEAPIADMVRSGVLRFSDPAPRERFLERAGRSGEWCLSHQVWTGQSVPVARCADCGQIAVTVEPDDSCSKCMGQLVADEDVLDSRFVGALWPLVSAGWPDATNGPVEQAPYTTLFVDGPGVTSWALPAAALGLALTGSLPFCSIAVHPLHGLSELDPTPVVDVDALVAHGRPTARMALALATIEGGVPDVGRAARLLATLEDPPPGDVEFDAVASAFDDCFAAGTPAAALPRLEAALENGVTVGQAERLRALAAPFTGE